MDPDITVERAPTAQAGHQPLRGEGRGGGELERAALGPVSRTPRFERTKSAVPRCSSSCLMWWLTAEWVTQSSSAAFEKLRCRAADSKARKELSGNDLRSTPRLSLM
jgi:hypothetical protein